MSRTFSLALCALMSSAALAQFPDQSPPGQPVPGQPMPGQQMPGQPMPGQPAQPGPAQPGPANPMGEFANAPAPAWVKEGIRLTYKATAPQNGFGGGGGGGLVTIDIVSVARGEVGLDVRVYADPTGQGQMSVATTAGVVTPAGAGEYWVSPQALPRMAQQPPAGMRVQQGQMPFNGKNVAVFVVESQLMGRSVYDAQSGILLKNEGPQSSQELMDMRERKLPWVEGRPPSWLAKTKQLTYSGQMRMNQPGMPGQAANVMARYDVIGVGANMMATKRSIVFEQGGMQQAGPEAVMVFGASQAMGVWVPPLGLKQLRQGQVLDEDRPTGAKLSVSQVGRTQYGRNAATIVEESPAYVMYADYELETGILLYSTFVDKLSGTSIQLSFTDRR